MKSANPDDPRLKALLGDTSLKNIGRKVIPACCPRRRRTYPGMLPYKGSNDRPALWERPSSADIPVVGTPAGFDNEFARRNTTIMTCNYVHPATLIRNTGGIPECGNGRQARYDDGRFYHDIPEPAGR